MVETALFGSGSGHSGSAKLMPSLTHTARSVTVPNLAFVLAAWLWAFGLSMALAAERAGETPDGGSQDCCCWSWVAGRDLSRGDAAS